MILPDKKDAVITFCTNHAAAWADDPPAVGLDASEVADLSFMAVNAFTKRQNVDVTRNAFRSAVIEQDAAINTMRNKAAILLKKIKVFADGTADPQAIYALADLPLPSSGDDLPPPPAPGDVTAKLNNSGTVTVKWDVPMKNAYKGKTFYIVQRSLSAPEGSGAADVPFTTVASSHDRAFTDFNVPTGYTKASYRIIATRNGENSDTSEEAVINFGVAGSLPMGESLAEAA